MTIGKPFITLSEVLASAETWSSHLEFFLPRDQHWSGGTVGALLDPDDDEDPDNPEFARLYSLKLALGIPEIQDIISNAKQQDPATDQGKLLQAFLFYFRNDAFIDFTKPEQVNKMVD